MSEGWEERTRKASSHLLGLKMSSRRRMDSPERVVRRGHRQSFNIKVESGSGLSTKNEDFEDPVMNQIRANLPSIGVELSESNGAAHEEGCDHDFASEVKEHFDEMLLPEEWLELDPVYLQVPPSLESKEFTDILEVCASINCFICYLSIFFRNLIWLIFAQYDQKKELVQNEMISAISIET